jgi:hypothetical protein
MQREGRAEIDGGAEKTKTEQNKTKKDRIQQTRRWRATAASGLVRAIPLLCSFFSRAPIAVRAKVWLMDTFVFAGLAFALANQSFGSTAYSSSSTTSQTGPCGCNVLLHVPGHV